jgi:L-histidine Nalpha-methyltransferase
MTTDSLLFDLDCAKALSTHEELIREVQRGLGNRPRSLAPWMFYDACGSLLFEHITQLPEYYLTRTERTILAHFANAIITRTRSGKSKPIRLLEFGAGTAEKTCILLEGMERFQRRTLYIPIDVSSEALKVASAKITSSLPEVCVQPVVANYVKRLPPLERFNGTTLAVYIGSNIGNFSPKEARLILRNLWSELQAGDALLLGTDLVKDEPILVAAYDDREGITAKFNLNVLHRLNRELGADFDPANFQHCIVWNGPKSRIEMHLRSTCDQQVYIADANLDLHFTKSETIHTENSYKFRHETIGPLLQESGFDVEQTWMDERNWYAVTLARCR